MFLVNGMFLIEKASFVAGPDSFNAVSTLTGLTGNSLELLYNDYQERSAAMKSTMKDLACPLEPNDMEELKLKAAAVTAEKPLKLRSGRSERASTLLTANNGDVFPCLCVMEDGWFALLLENGKIAYAPPGQAVLR
jgi:hypothetical protein